MKKIIALLLALVMAIGLVACGEKTPDPTKPVETEPAVTTEPVVDATEPADTVENAVTFFSMAYGDTYDNILSMTAYANEDGTTYIEYVGEEKKIGNIEGDVLATITAELEKTELATLNGQDVYGEGEANGSMYIEFADGTSLTVNYTGEIPEAFTNAYDVMDACFQTLTADMEVYVPQPMIMGEIDEAMMTEIMAILNGSAMPNLDGIAVSDIAVDDEFFANAVGLTSADGIAHAVSAAPMMMSQAYSLIVVELAEGADAEAIGADFEKNIDWMKWVCVAPSNALIAVKDNMVLCLQAADDAYTMTVAGIDAAGWTHVNELTNPNL